MHSNVGGCCLASKSYAGSLGVTNTAIHEPDSLANTNAISYLAASRKAPLHAIGVTWKNLVFSCFMMARSDRGQV